VKESEGGAAFHRASTGVTVMAAFVGMGKSPRAFGDVEDDAVAGPIKLIAL